MSEEEKTICAWHEVTPENPPQEGESHGICEPCSLEILGKHHWNKLQAIPSYIEQQAYQFAYEEE